VAKVDGRLLVIDDSVGSLGSVAADPLAVRLAIGAVMLGAIEQAAKVTCRANGSRLEVALEGGAPVRPGEDVSRAVQDAGIEMQAEHSAITITFPR
jgi:hypothetical protein